MTRDESTMTIEELSTSTHPSVWVVNSSEETLDNGAQADVFVVVAYNGQSIPVSVPKSWLPVNLAARLPKKALVESTYFLEACYKKLITIVTPEYAAELNARPSADSERKRLKELEEAVHSASRAKGINVEVVDLVKGKGSAKSFNMDDIDEKATSAATEEVPVAFRGLVVKLNSMSETDAVNELRMRGKMNETSARYLVDNIQHANIKAHIIKQLASE